MSGVTMRWVFAGWYLGKSDTTGSASEPQRQAVSHAEEKVVSETPSLRSRDANLIAQIKAGDQTALGAVYDAYYPSLWRLGLILTRSADLAKEVVHDVFLTLWERRATLHVRGGDLRVYLNAAVRNRVRNLAKHARVADVVRRAVQDESGAMPGTGQPLPSPDAALHAAEFWVAYERMLVALPERDRVALRLRWEESMTFEQIAAVLGLSSMGARAVVLRAQRRVQRALADYRDR